MKVISYWNHQPRLCGILNAFVVNLPKTTCSSSTKRYAFSAGIARCLSLWPKLCRKADLMIIIWSLVILS